MLRTASSLPLAGLLTLGSGPARFQTEPPACYRASWQLPGPDFHRQATTSLRTRANTMAFTSRCHLLLCWAHEKTSMDATHHVFNLDVGGNKNSGARIHLGESSPESESKNPITTLGRVGIGTTSTQEMLEVDGNILVTGDITLAWADCAEEFDVVGTPADMSRAP